MWNVEPGAHAIEYEAFRISHTRGVSVKFTYFVYEGVGTYIPTYSTSNNKDSRAMSLKNKYLFRTKYTAGCAICFVISIYM